MNQLCSSPEVQSLCHREKRSNLAKFHLAILFATLITGNNTNNVTNQRLDVSKGCAKGIGPIRTERIKDNETQSFTQANLTS
jgi:hypothetical protein